VSLAFNNHCRKSAALFSGTSRNASPTPELEFAYTTFAVAAKHSDSAKILITTSLPTGRVFGVSTKHPLRLILATRGTGYASRFGMDNFRNGNERVTRTARNCVFHLRFLLDKRDLAVKLPCFCVTKMPRPARAANTNESQVIKSSGGGPVWS
jgi:hypothetical protein